MAKRAASRLSWEWPGRFQMASVSVMLAAVFAPACLVHAADSASSDSKSSNAITVSLKYQETDYRVINWNVSLATQTSPFTKEPKPASGKIIRGTLNFRDDSSNSVPFIWEQGARKLYLDLNRNRDLTDDANGVISASEQRPAYYQTFTNVHLIFNTASGRNQALADISFYDYGSRPRCNFAVRSFWQGRVTLHGREWQVGVVPGRSDASASFNNNRLLLRSWENRNQPFNTYDGSLATVSCSRRLFVDGHAYEMDLVSNDREGGTMTLRFVEQTAPTGELKITGKYIQRLVLSGGPYLVVLDRPPAAVQVPVGRYYPPDILLEQGGTKACYKSSQRQTGKAISIGDAIPATLVAGGPLTNFVAATRHGRNLNLNYQLLGAGGAAFQLANEDYSKPPEFAIYKDAKKIASGKFQYG